MVDPSSVPAAKSTQHCERAPRRTADEAARWLATKPSVAEVRARFPREWEQVRGDLDTIVAQGEADRVKEYLVAATRAPHPTRDHARKAEVVVSEVVRRYLTIELTRQAVLSAQTGVRQGRVRFGLVNGYILQRLLFEEGLRRKPVNLPLFRLLWPLLPQRRRLLPLVMPEGIYCFYSAPLLRRLALLIGDRSCLEIAAGDGTLARLLTDHGVDVVATDDFSWQISDRGDRAPVAQQDAVSALREHRPRVVVCSWPPPGNTFERHVFRTPSVELYLLITSRHEAVAGNWAAYRAATQTTFTMDEDARLSRLILPGDAGGAVYLFRRRVPVPPSD